MWVPRIASKSLANNSDFKFVYNLNFRELILFGNACFRIEIQDIEKEGIENIAWEVIEKLNMIMSSKDLLHLLKEGCKNCKFTPKNECDKSH